MALPLRYFLNSLPGLDGYQAVRRINTFYWADWSDIYLLPSMMHRFSCLTEPTITLWKTWLIEPKEDIYPQREDMNELGTATHNNCTRHLIGIEDMVKENDMDHILSLKALTCLTIIIEITLSEREIACAYCTKLDAGAHLESLVAWFEDEFRRLGRLDLEVTLIVEPGYRHSCEAIVHPLVIGGF